MSILSPQVIGTIAGVFTASSLLPQFIKILKEKKAEDISVPMLFTLFTGQALWLYYGILQEDWPIILTNAFSLIFNMGVIILRYRYRKAVGSGQK